MGTTYTSVFGGEAIPSSDNSYAAVALTADTTFFWPDLATGTNLIADNMDVTSSAVWNMTFPDANVVSVGRAVAISNKGAFAINILDASGGAIGSIAAGVTKLIWLTDNTTVAGVWTLFTLGTGTSSADASQLAGAGLVPLAGLLASEIPVLSVVANLTLNATHRAKCLDFTAASKTLTMMLASVAGTGFVVGVKNSTTGSVTITASGSDLLDLVSSFNLSPQESCWLVSTGTSWLVLNRGQSTLFQFTKLVKDISSATSFTLTSAEASNKLMQFIGTPTANTTIIVPSVVAVYYIQNNFTNNGYTLTLKTAAGAGVITKYFDRVVVYCDGVDVVLAQSTDAAAAAASALLAEGYALAAAASEAACLAYTNAAALSETNAAASALAAAGSETGAGASALLASQWAVLTSGQVAATDYSSKAYAIGGTGVTNNIGAAKEWATRTGSGVISGEFSTKEWAIGTFIRNMASGGSAKDWASYTGGTADNAEYSAKGYALGGTGITNILGSAKEWAGTTGATVIAGAYSAKEWAVGIFTRGVVGGGSAKDWATYIGGTVDNAEYSAKKYAQDALNYGVALTSTSADSLTPAVGAMTFTTQAGKAYVAGQFFSAVSLTNSAVYAHGTVTSYIGTALVVNVTDIGTALLKNDWAISVSGSQGTKGDTGLGVPVNLTLTNPATAATLTIAGGQTLTTVGAFGATLTFTNTTNATLPAGTVTLAALGVAQTWTGIQTHNNSTLKLLGSSTGATTFTSANTNGTNYTITIPAVTDTLAVKGANTFTAGQVYSDFQNSRAMFIDCGYTVLDKGNVSNATVTFDYTGGSVQTYTATGSTVTWATSNWPPTGNLGELLIIGTNMGAFTHSITGLTWTKLDGTTTTSVATFLAQNGTRTAFQSSGVDKILLVSRDAGTTIYATLLAL